MPTTPDERVEVLDVDGRVVGVVSRAEMRRERLRHRAVFIAVLDATPRLLVHRRSADKDLWPSRWDIAAGGVVAAGESWADAAARELEEELGIRSELRHLGGGRHEDDDVKVVAEVFLARHDGPVHFVDGEVAEARWVDPLGLEELLASEVVCPDSVAIVRPFLKVAGFG